jgi:hypothetical protein
MVEQPSSAVEPEHRLENLRPTAPNELAQPSNSKSEHECVTRIEYLHIRASEEPLPYGALQSNSHLLSTHQYQLGPNLGLLSA